MRWQGKAFLLAGAAAAAAGALCNRRLGNLWWRPPVVSSRDVFWNFCVVFWFSRHLLCVCRACEHVRTWLERFRFQCVFRFGFALSLSSREQKEEEWSNVRVLFGFDWVNGIQLASGSSRCTMQSQSANLGHVVNWQRLTYCCSTSPSQIQLLFTCAQ